MPDWVTAWRQCHQSGFIPKIATMGKALNAVRDDESAAEAMTVNTRKTKMVAFMFGAFWAGMAGGLLAHYDAILAAPAVAWLLLDGWRPAARRKVGPLLAALLICRPEFRQNARRNLLYIALWTLPALIWLPIWWLAPKGISGGVGLSGLEAILQNTTYFGQGIAYPLTWLGGRLLAQRWFSRKVLLERWFLHRHAAPLVAE